MSGVLWLREGVCTREQVNGSFSAASCFYLHGIQASSSPDRFAVALEPLLDSLQMVQNHIMPGKLTWPFTKDVVQETEPGYLKVCRSFIIHV